MKKRKIWLIIAIIGLVVMGCTSPNDNDTNNTTVNPCANGHDMQPVAGEMEVAPTCEDEGFGKVACARTGCGYTENGASIPALGHTGTVEPFAATCTIAGNSALSGDCVRFAQCSHVVMGAVIPASHSFTEWQETTPATCLEAAIDTEECGVCGVLGTETDAGHHALGHSSGVGAVEVSCEVDGYSGGSGPCIREGCDVVLPAGEVIPKWNHQYHDWTAPTCTMAGNSERECVNDCGTIDTRSTGYAALGHTGSVAAFAATCTTAGNSALSGNCVRFDQCGHVVTGTGIAALGHDHGTSGTGSLICKRNDCDHQYAIGATGPAGGIIFYVADGQNGRPFGIAIQGYGSPGDNGYFADYTAYYLEAAPANEGWLYWGPSGGGPLIAGITTWTSNEAKDAGLAASIGVGRKDTQTIVNHTAFASSPNTAARRCANKTVNGFTDWFLPSLGELNEMYKAKGQTGIPTTQFFWSSSQRDLNAWGQNFTNGNQFVNSKDSLSGDVRAIRAF